MVVIAGAGLENQYLVTMDTLNNIHFTLVLFLS
jgi:hypothetical protein